MFSKRDHKIKPSLDSYRVNCAPKSFLSAFNFNFNLKIFQHYKNWKWLKRFQHWWRIKIKIFIVQWIFPWFLFVWNKLVKLASSVSHVSLRKHFIQNVMTSLRPLVKGQSIIVIYSALDLVKPSSPCSLDCLQNDCQ